MRSRRRPARRPALLPVLLPALLPGLSLPLAPMMNVMEKAKWEIHSVENITYHYKITIKKWHDNWLSNKETVLKANAKSEKDRLHKIDLTFDAPYQVRLL